MKSSRKLLHPKDIPASIDRIGALPNIDFLRAIDLSRKFSRHGIDTTVTFMPFVNNSLEAETATSTSDPEERIVASLPFRLPQTICAPIFTNFLSKTFPIYVSTFKSCLLKAITDAWFDEIASIQE